MGRAEQGLDILDRIRQVLGDGLELGQVFQRAVALLSERLNIRHAALVLWDEALDQLRIVVAVGLRHEEIARGRYALGEGVTGKVLATSQPQIVPDISRHPDFLNRTGSQNLGDGEAGGLKTNTRPVSFICVPVKDSERFVGTISVDKPYVDDEALAADATGANAVTRVCMGGNLCVRADAAGGDRRRLRLSNLGSR